MRAQVWAQAQAQGYEQPRALLPHERELDAFVVSGAVGEPEARCRPHPARTSQAPTWPGLPLPGAVLGQYGHEASVVPLDASYARSPLV